MSDQPIRTCVGCRTRRPQGQLVRLHVDAEDRIRVSRTGPGRGAWLCAADPVRCFDEALAGRAIERAFRRRIDRAVIESVRRDLVFDAC